MKTESRGLLAGLSLEALRARTRQEPYRPYWERLTRRWREVAAWEQATGRMVTIGACAGPMIVWLVREAALDYRLTGAPDALDYVARQVDKLADLFLRHPERWTSRQHPYWSEMHVCLAADLCRDGLDARRLGDLTRLVRERFLEAPYIGWNSRDRYLSGHNMAITEQACAGICAWLWGEESGRADWERVLQAAIESAMLYGRYSIDPGGFGYEGTMYSYAPMDTLYLLAQILFQNGRANLFETIPALKAYPEALRHLLFPDRVGLLPLADGGILNPKPYAFLLLTARHYGRPEDLGLWYEYRGPGRAADPIPDNNPRIFHPDVGPAGPVRRDGWGHDLLPFLWWEADAPRIPVAASPQSPVCYSPGTETAFFRTSWNREAVFLQVNGQGRSHGALDHAHADGGHVSIFAHGEYLAIDTGYWNILEDQHSVVLIDGAGRFQGNDQDRCRRHVAGRLADFQRHPLLDYIRVDQAHPRNCLWADRHVLFIRLGGDDAYVVLVDNLNPDHGVHTFQWQLHAHPESEVRLTGPRSAVLEKTRARLEITFLSPLPEDFPGCPHTLRLAVDEVYGRHVAPEGADPAGRGWTAFAYTRPEARELRSDLTYSCWLRPRLVAEQKGPNCLLMSVLSPRRADAPVLAVTDRSARRVFRAEIAGEHGVDTVIAAPDRGWVEFEDIRGCVELAVVRRDRSGVLVDAWHPGAQGLWVAPRSSAS